MCMTMEILESRTRTTTASVGLTFRAYHRRQNWLAAVLALQLVGGLGVLLTPEQEIFPLFSWFLFPLTPDAGVRYEVQILEYRGQIYAMAMAPSAIPGAVVPVQLPTVVALGRRLGVALAAGDEAEVRRLRGLLEGGLMPGVGRYALVAVTYDPIARLRTGTEQVVRVREFKSGQP
jgi:hypothetical protein